MDEIIRDVSCLTNRQREAYKLRAQGLTYQAIGEQLGITMNAARQLCIHAERRFCEYTRYQKIAERNLESVTMDFTRGELKIIMEALTHMERAMSSHAIFKVNSMWEERLPYEARIIVDVYRKAAKVIYGEEPKVTHLFAGAFDSKTEEEPPE